jgi:hypothetical protein
MLLKNPTPHYSSIAMIRRKPHQAGIFCTGIIVQGDKFTKGDVYYASGCKYVICNRHYLM